MEYNVLIKNMTIGDEVEGFYVLKAAYPKTTASGKPFLSATLSDKTGAIEIKVWDYTGPIRPLLTRERWSRSVAMWVSIEELRRSLSIEFAWRMRMTSMISLPWCLWPQSMWAPRWAS